MKLQHRLTRLTPAETAGLALLFNLPFALLRLHRGSFDTYIHIFLADHYRRAWFDLWEPRWYLGFSMASYPPLIHQLIALLSVPLEASVRFFSPTGEPFRGAWRWAGEEAGYLVVALVVLALFPLAVRSFARLFVGPRAASVAGLLGILMPGLGLVLWSFGQLPSTAATAIVLLAVTKAYHYLQCGRKRHLLQTVLLAGLAAATHHGVFLLVPFAAAAVTVQAAAVRGQSAAPARPSVFARRVLTWAVLSGAVVAVVLWPLLAWSRGQSLQVPIDHLSRHNLLTNIKGALFFFWPMYGPLLLVLPWAAWAAWRGTRRRRLAPVVLALSLLVMGLGGTTPLPRLLYRSGWEWLTYERFAFWAALVLVVPAGAMLLRLARRSPLAAGLFGVSMLISAAIAGALATVSRSQPRAVDLAPLVRFLTAPEQQPYRYFTLGFGDQLARLAAITDNGTPDGSYHTARDLPELRASGIGSIDTVMWTHSAARARPFLDRAAAYGARWAFVNHAHYPPVLRAAGWVYRFDIGSVQAWEKRGVAPVPVSPPPGLDRSPAALWWGVCPLAVLAAAVFALAAERRWQAWRAGWTRPRLAESLGKLRLWAWGLTAVLLTLWWHHILYQGTTPWVYYVYQSALLFAADAAAAITLVVWAAEQIVSGRRLGLGPRGLLLGGVGLIAAAVLSVPASADVAATWGVIGHLLLLGGWYLMLVNDPPPPRTVGSVWGGVLAAQAVVALAQVATQSSAWLDGFGLPWPRELDPQRPGVSVVMTPAGGRWLRAYGTLSHPNVLGGYLLLGLGMALERFLATRGRGWLAAGWLMLAALALSFSRSAWLGALALTGAGAGLRLAAGRVQPADSARVRRWAAAGLGAAALVGLPLLPLVLGRAGLGAGQPLEERSIDERLRLNRAAAEMVWDRPLFGVGAGAFTVRLYQVAGVDLTLQPAHNLPLLLAAEMGSTGAAALSVMAAAAGWRIWRRRRVAAPAESWMGAVLLGMLVSGMFDHYWWTLPPARMVLTSVLGLWVGWGEAASRGASPGHAGSAQSATQSAEPTRG